MNNITSKLRKKNKNYYTMLVFCTILSVVLVTSYSLMFFSPTVENVLPQGGDSRKQGLMIFAIAIAGCAVFSTYASTLFFRYKSREFGIFMALGERKSKIKKLLIKELSIIIPICSLIGLLLSIPVSFIIWKIFQIFIVDTKEMTYYISPSGFIFGIIFCIFVIVSITITGARFIKRSNLIDIIYESRKTESVKEIPNWYGGLGWFMVVTGVILGYAVPHIVIRKFGYLLSGAWNIVYVISLAGVYFVMLHAIICAQKGKNPKKYYRNIISTNMMKFAGKQTVKNMCIITFLIAASLFAAFYVPTMVNGSIQRIYDNPVDYSFYYMETENQISKSEIYELATKHQVNITSYQEIESLLLIVDGEVGGYVNNKLVKEYVEKIGNGEFFSESEFNRVTGQSIDVKNGEYYYIIVPEEEEDALWRKWDEVSLVTKPMSEETKNLQYAGNVEFVPFADQAIGRYVISDEDYSFFEKGLTSENKDRFVLFNVENPNKTYQFGKELLNIIITRSSPDSAVSVYSDAYARKVAKEKGEEVEDMVDLSIDNTKLYAEWKYYPSFGVVDRQDFVRNMAVYLMMFIYISIICFITVAIIAYTRSITIAVDNKLLFEDLRRLGANNKYIKKVVNKQLIKIFIYPTVVGSVAIYLFYILILYGNSGGITSYEIGALQVNFIIILALVAAMYGVYQLAYKKVCTIIC